MKKSDHRILGFQWAVSKVIDLFIKDFIYFRDLTCRDVFDAKLLRKPIYLAG